MVGIRTICLEVHRTTLGCSQHHYAHDALGIDSAAFATDPDLTSEASGELCQFGRRARVQTELIDDFNLP